MEKNEPRWKSTNNLTADDYTKFLGYANDLDVWLLPIKSRLLVVGPMSKRTAPDSDHNYDAFDIEDGVLVLLDEPIDLYIDVHDMCLIYALCAEHGVFKGD
jgi:hypothetical protein